MLNEDLFFMKEAFKEAKKAYYKNEVPVGAVAVLNNQIIARTHNNCEKKQIFFGHAEFLLMMKLNKKFKNRRLNKINIYVTLEPCLMCAGALIQTQINKVYYSVNNYKSGSIDSVISLLKFKYPHKIITESGLLAKENKILLKNFFKNLRNY
ncbi:CMP/dCMP deaminase zinc-binding protein [Candidatus Phytoplasma mali]|uniref:CMP/dCMP deaminase zinc-binding protein n=1 Tax=Phytoplasma mali (strain AT) TaxID=482235 RepID=B3R0G2_PHYMT|nr:nucleoside deaminase [Candidatus Phytoplasma mali]CAP18326.1 CMP/dCMP deaminase zinc-binding protein [Candidatus Phytoplasma mali]